MHNLTAALAAVASLTPNSAAANFAFRTMTWLSWNGYRILWRNHSQAMTIITSTLFPLPPTNLKAPSASSAVTTTATADTSSPVTTNNISSFLIFPSDGRRKGRKGEGNERAKGRGKMVEQQKGEDGGGERKRWQWGGGVQADGFQATKLFVFGDSYADTGNRESTAISWPYGITTPGYPDGRFSDGLILTDFVAEFYGMDTPVAYTKINKTSDTRYGVNFAYGGAGVFDTLTPVPNITTQIDFLEELVNESVISTTDLESSLFLISCVGNDYLTYLATHPEILLNPDLQDLINALEEISRVVDQIAVNLKRLIDLGARKIAVTSLQTLGCLPVFASSPSNCNNILDVFPIVHNVLLREKVANLNNENSNSTIIILDLFTTFRIVLGTGTFDPPYQACLRGNCTAVYGYGYGYTDQSCILCDDRNSAFFWDVVHPTEAGWRAAFEVLKPTLEQITSFTMKSII